MQPIHRLLGASTLTLLGAVLVLAPNRAEAGHSSGFSTAVKPYAVSISTEYGVLPILSVGDRVPLTGDATRQFQLIGIPDGLGAYKASGHKIVLYMNHEIGGTPISEPVIGGPLRRGALVSRFILNDDAEVLSGEPAYDVIVDGATGLELPAALVGNSTPAFVRICSGTLVWHDAGFDRPIYFCGEENAAPDTFDGKGGLALAIFDGKLHTLPQLGHFSRENTLVRPLADQGDDGDENDEEDDRGETHGHDRGQPPGSETVLIMMEDGSKFDSQLYMYVGRKDRSRGASPLARNGLVGGKFYVFASTTPGVNVEPDFQSGSIAGRWVEITGVADMDEAQLEAAADASGAFGFAKSEDGAWSKRDNSEFFFNSTGDTVNTNVAGNHLGRTYRLNVNRHHVTGPCTLTLLYNADLLIAAGGDIAIDPDNIGVSKNYLMVCEDGSGYGRTVMGQKGRDGLIWRYDLRHNYEATPVVSLAAPGRDGVAVGPGVWETSGIIDAESFYGRNSWLFVVQAHPPTAAPAPNTVEDGQLLLLFPLK